MSASILTEYRPLVEIAIMTVFPLLLEAIAILLLAEYHTKHT